MDQTIFEKVRNTITVITIIESRAEALKEDLDFYFHEHKACEPSDRYNLNNLNFGLMRLKHEVMFLCIDAFSLHEGISKKKSLLSKVIKENGKKFTKVDKTPVNLILCHSVTEEGEVVEASEEESKTIRERINKMIISDRKEIQKNDGISSVKHENIDEWMKRSVDLKLISELSNQRDIYAHRLNSLDKLTDDLRIIDPMSIMRGLETVSTVLKQHKSSLQKILVYTNAQQFQGVSDFEYESLARLRQYKRNAGR